MANAPILTDRRALERNRTRAMRQPALFLHDTAAEELEHRLSMVNRQFNSAAIISGFPDFWRGFLPDATHISDSDVLSLEPETYDLVIHAMALHWANDPVGQVIQARRALKPDGLFLSVAFGGRTLHELRAALATAESEVTGGLSPRVAPMAEIRDMGALLQRAGLALPVADSLPLNVTYASPLHLMRELRQMGENNALNDRLRRPTRRKIILRAAEIYAQAHGTENGRIPATFELIFLSGWAPDDSQPKPLRPGSASARLADALNAHETKLPD